jgi:methylated-DNA-[protein]-cysteine S-methyltransferase
LEDDLDMSVVHALVPFARGFVKVMRTPECSVTGLTFDPAYRELAPSGSVPPTLAQDRAVSGEGEGSPPERLTEELVRYFNGEKVQWSLTPDLTAETAFARAVYERAMKVPYGETVTYGQVASDIGSPGGARAVGQAMSRNRFPLVIPCHRVIAADGKIGGFSSGIDLKKYLLELEGYKLGGA